MRHILLAATALAMLSGSAYASSTGSNSQSTATAVTQSGAASKSAAYGNVGNSSNININTYAGVDSSGGSSGSGATAATTTSATDPTANIHYSGGYTVRNTPDVTPPNVLGGNPCAVGASGGLSMSGFGIAAGATWADKQCERRQQAALLFNMGEQRVAVELMCQDEHVREAMRLSGKPCTVDLAAAQAPATAAAPAARAPSVMMVAAAAPARTEPKREWCARAAPTTEASKAYVAQVCGQ